MAAMPEVTHEVTDLSPAPSEAGRGSRCGPLLSAPDPSQSWLGADLAVRRLTVYEVVTVAVLRVSPGVLREPGTVQLNSRPYAAATRRHDTPELRNVLEEL